MKKLKKINAQLLNSSDFRKVLTREERRRILGGDYDNCASEIATTSHSCDTPPNCGIDKDNKDGTACCIAC